MAVESGQAGIAIGVPDASLVAGMGGGAWLRQGPTPRSAFQHVAGGVIVTAATTEPEARPGDSGVTGGQSSPDSQLAWGSGWPYGP
ncbi:MAG: hypothetical protein QF733_07520 [Phycisphaerales bacterium]|jgi:hypothetical protein|nr:hypothetical protein [Phycisphaerales bacterium]